MKLYIDSAECPFDSSVRLGLSYSAEALADVESSRQGVGITLAVPATAQTDDIFGAARDVLSARRFNAAHHTARIEFDGVTLHSGTAVLLGTECTADGAARYTVGITGGSSKWAESAARSRFSAIPLDCMAHFTPSGIEESWTSDGPVKLLPVLRDTYERTNSSVGLAAPERMLSVDDFHPFVSVAALVEAIFAQSGYTVRSDFFATSIFRSLYVSGAYASTDVAALRNRMDFSARRSADGESTADANGRVYFSPYMTVCSVGNFVDSFTADAGDGLYTRGDCLGLEEDQLVFRPTTTVRAGFEYGIRYVTDYRIRSRTRLTGFDTVYLPPLDEVRFELANRFEDRRDGLRPRFSYRVVVFDHVEGASYRLVCTSAEGQFEMGRFSTRSASVATSSSSSYGDPVLYRFVSEGIWRKYTGDWALYDGYVGETGRMEVHVTLRTPAEELSATSPKKFHTMYMSGAERGMTLRMLEGCTLRPDFSSAPGYGAKLTFADISHHAVRQSEFLESLRQMFNLRFHTDEELREVRIEPATMFFNGVEADWSDRIDLSRPVASHDLALEAHDTLTLGYRDDDGAVRRFNAANDTVFGEWSAQTGCYGATQGVETVRSPMFSPTINVDGQYESAPSALLMQVCDRDDASGSTAVTPRIVIWFGMKELPAGERWVFPAGRSSYPLAAFNLPPWRVTPTGGTLCYEDRDGGRGLHRYYDAEVERRRTARAVTLYMRLSPDDWAALHRTGGTVPGADSVFRLTIGGETGRYMLRSVEDYDPRDASTRCTFEQLTTIRE
ncbi:MAG: hypothetical protein K2J51_08530 [Alistipes sp.]|nr:hypothetical protein [Alistipes sp.]